MTSHPTVQDSDRSAPTGRRLELAGMAADSYGVDDERAPLVLLHGLTYNRSTWLPVLAELERVDPGRRVVALDLPGHGESPENPPHTIEHVAELLHRAVTEAGLAEPVVVGHSMSGGLAVMYAAAHPVRGVVDIDSPPDEFVSFSRLLTSMAPQLRGPGFDQIWAGLRSGFRLDLLPGPIRDLVDSASTPRQELVLSYWQEVLDGSPDDIEPMLDGVARRLGQRGTPLVLLLGHEPSATLAPFLTVIGGEARVVVWPGTGHFPHLARLPQFADLLASTAEWRPSPALPEEVTR